MSFLWVQMLWLLALLPALAAACWFLLGRRARRIARYPGLSRSPQTAHANPAWRRHAPHVMLLVALVVLIVAMARPVMPITVFAPQQTVILAMDVSASMRAEDVWPDRLAASQRAAKAFVGALPADIRIGIVAYGGTAHVVQPVTRNRESVFEAIDGFRLQPGTAIGNGLIFALATLFPHENIDIERLSSGHDSSRDVPIESAGDDRHEGKPVAPGSYPSAVIVLLSDGQNTTGVDPLEAAKRVARMGVKVFTVGFGTPDGDVIQFGGWKVRVRLDEETLKQIAEITGGEYFQAATGPELHRAYETMKSRLALETRETEVTALFAALGALLVVAASGLSFWWYARVF
jgi:Ca-activated chloride channel family protein